MFQDRIHRAWRARLKADKMYAAFAHRRILPAFGNPHCAPKVSYRLTRVGYIDLPAHRGQGRGPADPQTIPALRQFRLLTRSAPLRSSRSAAYASGQGGIADGGRQATKYPGLHHREGHAVCPPAVGGMTGHVLNASGTQRAERSPTPQPLSRLDDSSQALRNFA